MKIAERLYELAAAAKATLLADAAAKEGYDAGEKYNDAYNATRGLAEPPRCPHPAGSDDAAKWWLGYEQAHLEGGSPDSWRDGGGGHEGALRLVEQRYVLLDEPDLVAAGNEARAAVLRDRERTT